MRITEHSTWDLGDPNSGKACIQTLAEHFSAPLSMLELFSHVLVALLNPHYRYSCYLLVIFFHNDHLMDILFSL